MAIEFKKPEVEHVGSWQQTFTRTCSERIQKAIKRAIQRPEICLERARAEVKAYQKYKDEPHIIQRAQAFATYLLERNIAIREGELIVGSVTSKHRASPIFPECCATFLDRELDDPEKDFSVRRFDTHVIHPEERKELREVIIPFWKGKTIEDYMYSIADAEVKEKSWPMTASCPHIPVVADVSVQKDAGHQMPNYEKVLYKGLNGIKKEAEAYLAELEQPYT